MHILYVEFGYPHPHGGGGAGTFVQLAGRELVKRGHQVSVIAAHCPQCGEHQEDEGVEIYRPQSTGPLHWYASRVPLLKILAMTIRTLETGWRVARQIDQIHQRQPINLIEFSDWGDVWHTLRHTIPYIAHLHGSRYTFLRMSGRPTNSGDWLERRLGLWCIRKADQIISPSQAMLDAVQEEAGIKFPGAIVKPYPLDPRLLEITNAESSSGRQNTAKTIFFAARNDPVKGGDVLIRAIPPIRQQYPDTKFHFFGYEPTPELKEIAGDSAVFKSFLPKNQLLKEYAQSDICVIPSFWDNSPNTIYEALASAKPVIISRAGGMPELVIEGETGLLFNSGSSAQLAEAIKSLLANPSKILSMGQAARKHILSISELSKDVDQRVEMYLRVCAQSKIKHSIRTN